MQLSVLACAAVLVLGAAPAPTPASKRRSATLVKEAERLYSSGKYRESADLLKKAFELEPIPRLLYNIGRAYDQAGDLTLALDAYREFVALAEGEDPLLVRRANLAVDRLRALIARDAAARELEEREHERLEQEARAARQREKAEAERAREQREEYARTDRTEAETRATNRGSGRTLTYVVGGVGAAALVSGIAFGIASASSRSGFDEARDLASKQRFESETRGRAIAADVSYAVAIAAGAGAVYLYLRSGGVASKQAAQQTAPGLAVTF